MLRRQVALQRQQGEADDGVQGGADLMAHVGQKLGLGGVGGVRRVLGTLQLLRHPPPFGHILLDGDEMADGPLLVADGRDGSLLPVDLAVFLLVAELPAPLVAGEYRAPEFPVQCRRLQAGAKDLRILPDRLLPQVAGDLGEFRVHVLDPPGAVRDHHGGRAVFDGPGKLQQFFLDQDALGDVQEGRHRPHDTAVAKLRVGPVLHRKGAAVGAPERFVLQVDPHPLFHGDEDRAVVLGKRAAVGMPVMDLPVHVLADQIARVGIPQHAQAGAVAEGAVAVQVRAVDRLRRGVEQQAELLFGALPGIQARLGVAAPRLKLPVYRQKFVVNGGKLHGALGHAPLQVFGAFAHHADQIVEAACQGAEFLVRPLRERGGQIPPDEAPGRSGEPGHGSAGDPLYHPAKNDEQTERDQQGGCDRQETCAPAVHREDGGDQAICAETRKKGDEIACSDGGYDAYVHRCGSPISTTSPPSAALRADMLPPCNTTVSSEMASPMPVPPLERSRASATR